MKENIHLYTNITSKILNIRLSQVMLDRDIAEIFGVKTIRLREQVKRNINRFPLDFMFQLNDEEVDFLVSQNAIPSRKHLGGFLPWVFTEQGIASLSSVLNSQQAIEANISIMRAFVEMRKFILTNAQLFQRLENVEQKQIESEKQINQILNALGTGNVEPKQGIFFNGEIFDAYVFVSKLIKSANQSLLLIDNYIDESILTLFTKRNLNVSVKIYTSKISKQLQLDIDKYNAQYLPIEVIEFKDSHDRFLIVDEKNVYHFGASLKDLGKKWFAFSLLEKSSFDIIRRL